MWQNEQFKPHWTWIHNHKAFLQETEQLLDASPIPRGKIKHLFKWHKQIKQYTNNNAYGNTEHWTIFSKWMTGIAMVYSGPSGNLMPQYVAATLEHPYWFWYRLKLILVKMNLCTNSGKEKETNGCYHIGTEQWG